MLSDSAFLDAAFSYGNLMAMVGWIILILLPRRWPLLFVIPSLIIPLLLSFAYGAVIMVVFFQSDGGGFSSLSAVRQLLSDDATLLAAWFHFLAFDLFIGTVIAKKADEIGVSRLIQTPILFLTFMAGPLGFFLFQMTYGGWKLFGRKEVVS